MKRQNLTNAIAALKAQVRARHSGDKQAFLQATEAVKAQGDFVRQVQQALTGNKENVTLANVTATWVKTRIREQTLA
ncbi:hypothetical protein ETN89_20005 (plasmid) [Photobacterium damselae subsp. damselae]|uniref:hypothetical protein n=1 Tax=Photobacterium damselae TaxID=38293 RepID=UPI000A2FD3CF|nr:hypothetical protein [Photobacterium damselae]ARR51786.1 hypothetical protein CAY62_20435 [Photobacterium damselae subsp. damselae]QAY37545.1 hypothetical protein ETN89_20005 [Photobacterium damselae subsp. damselae]